VNSSRSFHANVPGKQYISYLFSNQTADARIGAKNAAGMASSMSELFRVE
jgi:hypothetical protein